MSTSVVTISGTSSTRRQGALPDVATVLHAVEVDPLDQGVSRPLRLTHRLAQCGCAQDTTTIGPHMTIHQLRPGVEDLGIGCSDFEPDDLVTLDWIFRIPCSGQHDAERRTPVPVCLNA